MLWELKRVWSMKSKVCVRGVWTECSIMTAWGRVYAEGRKEAPHALAGVWSMVKCTCQDYMGSSVAKSLGRSVLGGREQWLLQESRTGMVVAWLGSMAVRNGEKSMELRDIWEVESARLSTETSLAKTILVCSTSYVNEIIFRHLSTPPSSPTVTCLSLFLVCSWP